MVHLFFTNMYFRLETLQSHGSQNLNHPGGRLMFYVVREENIKLKNWYVANGFIHTGTKQFNHLPFTVGFMECMV